MYTGGIFELLMHSTGIKASYKHATGRCSKKESSNPNKKQKSSQSETGLERGLKKVIIVDDDIDREPGM